MRHLLGELVKQFSLSPRQKLIFPDPLIARFPTIPFSFCHLVMARPSRGFLKGVRSMGPGVCAWGMRGRAFLKGADGFFFLFVNQHTCPGLPARGQSLAVSYPPLSFAGGYWGSIFAPGARQAFFFFNHSPPMPGFAPPPQTIWRTFSLCPRIWPIPCTRFMAMARVVVGSDGSDILCC